LLRWWQNYLQADPLRDLPALHCPEYRLTAAFGGFRLVGQYDLLAIQPGERVVIVDWKTTHYHLTAAYLKRRIQSRLYPLLLVEAGAGLNCGQPIKPEQIEMIYWFAAHPSQPVHLPYGADQYQIDRESLASMIHEIHALPAGRFTLTANEAHCKYCTYRSLCARGVSAGAWDDSDAERDRGEDALINLDFDQIGEIAF
ncbi:MAG: PD-(D/E)XK nuclease family protein, partial [Anaerolineaceae bacterium]|nr:PD-(D/E)XK nuclease family protein [Anaerolineaceae bacterium]